MQMNGLLQDWLAVLEEKEFILFPENERVKREDVVRVWTVDGQVLAELSRGRFLVLGEIPRQGGIRIYLLGDESETQTA